MALMFPLREPSIDALRNGPVYFRYGSNKRRVLVDGLTASAIVTIYEALNEENKAKAGRLITTPHGLNKLAGLAFKHCTIG